MSGRRDGLGVGAWRLGWRLDEINGCWLMKKGLGLAHTGSLICPDVALYSGVPGFVCIEETSMVRKQARQSKK
jgi:hypothetical protein